MNNEAIFRIIFTQLGKTYEIYAQYISEESLMGFIEVEELVFNEPSSVLVDPTEERLRFEFTDVKRCYIPMHAIARIDEIIKNHKAKEPQTKRGGNVSHFPNMLSSSSSNTE